YGGVINRRLVIVGAGMQRPLQKSLVIKAIHDRHDRSVGKTAPGTNGFLNIADRDGRAVPDGLHDIQFQRGQHYGDPTISIISRAASFPGAWAGIERMRKVNCRRGNRIETVSPT